MRKRGAELTLTLLFATRLETAGADTEADAVDEFSAPADTDEIQTILDSSISGFAELSQTQLGQSGASCRKASLPNSAPTNMPAIAKRNAKAIISDFCFIFSAPSGNDRFWRFVKELLKLAEKLETVKS
ncbi:MAG: hypothetical protein ACOYUZ_05345 [Patescibacteria group bacterium]